MAKKTIQKKHAVTLGKRHRIILYIDATAPAANRLFMAESPSSPDSLLVFFEDAIFDVFAQVPRHRGDRVMKFFSPVEGIDRVADKKTVLAVRNAEPPDVKLFVQDNVRKSLDVAHAWTFLERKDFDVSDRKAFEFMFLFVAQFFTSLFWLVVKSKKIPARRS